MQRPREARVVIDPRLPAGVTVVDPHQGHHRGYWGSDLVNRPELLEPPRAIVPYLAWQGRVTLTAGTDKVGKSTLWRQAAAAVTRGAPFLSGPTNGGRPGKVLWFGLEESLADIWRPFSALSVDPANLYIVNSVEALLGFRQALDVFDRWVLVVIDTLAAFASSCQIVSERDETEMTMLMQQILRAAREPEPFGGPGVGIVHHHTRGEAPRERGSGAIPANCDVILNICARKGDPDVVDVTPRDRIGVDLQPFALRKGDKRFTLTDASAAPIPLVIRQADQVLEYLINNPGSSAREMAKALKIRKESVTLILLEHERSGLVKNLSSTLKHPNWIAVAPVAQAGPGPNGTTGLVAPVGGSAGSPPKGGRNHGTQQPNHRESANSPAEFDRGEAWEEDEPNNTEDAHR